MIDTKGVSMNEPYFAVVGEEPLREVVPEPEMEKDELLSLSKLSRRICVSQKWLREECSANRLPHLDAGGRLLFSLLAVKQVLLERAAGSWSGDKGEM